MDQRVKVIKEAGQPRRKKPYVLVDGHKYNLQNKNTNTCNWQCCNKICKGKVKTTSMEEDAQLIGEPYDHDICHLKTTHGPSEKFLRSKNKCKTPSMSSLTPDQRSNRQEDAVPKLGHPTASKILSSPSDQSVAPKNASKNTDSVTSSVYAISSSPLFSLYSEDPLAPANASKNPNSVTSSIYAISSSPLFSLYSEDPRTYIMQEQPTESSKKVMKLKLD
uniref:FLYWCH-type domain-containing protein n=1 Tax=Panagrolaimus sp. ES5 TaxID=591445 RepID=A0AC34FEA6_9BILA